MSWFSDISDHLFHNNIWVVINIIQEGLFAQLNMTSYRKSNTYGNISPKEKILAIKDSVLVKMFL